AFDIANYESYVSSVAEKPYRLNADYLIFGYSMNADGVIAIKKLWLKKIWEIAGVSRKFPLKTQVKRGMIYNIRPNSEFKRGVPSPFTSNIDFLRAVYETHSKYKDLATATEWKEKLQRNYLSYYSVSIDF